MRYVLSARQVRMYILNARKYGLLRIVRMLNSGSGPTLPPVYRYSIAEVIEGYRRAVLL